MSANELTLFHCGRKHDCEHEMNESRPLYDESGRECGTTQVCTRCGTSAFELALWGEE
jgi:hypothetical protein